MPEIEKLMYTKENELEERLFELSQFNYMKDMGVHPFQEDWMIDSYIEGLTKELSEYMEGL